MYKEFYMNSTEKKVSLFDKFSAKKELAETKKLLHESNAQIDAISKVQAVISFNLDGTIIDANENFLNTLGYRIEEVQGKHHSMFVEPSAAQSNEYKQFWEALTRGEYQSKSYKRIGKGGKEVWIRASYNPIMDEDGKPYKVVKFATDITESKLERANFSGQMDAIDKSQAVIEFSMDGTVTSANDNFLNAVGYGLSEVKGKHHSMFVPSDISQSNEYKEFWNALRHGDFQSGEFKLIGKDGKEIWIQASYNPIFDLNGVPFKVVKYASDITEQKVLSNAVETILREISKVMLSLSEGRMNDRVEGDFSGEFSTLQNVTNQYCEKLSKTVGQIRQVGELVNTGANEISSGNLNLSARTETQAAALEQTSASMEEMTSTVVQNAGNAKQANELAINARSQAQTGGDVVKEAVLAMNEINQSSNKIANIISVIDEIAFQTNLLALNAAVEAARAGEQGRGFAVVASEVRNLAGRSASAAKEIKELIEDSVNKVEQGSRLVNQSGDTLEEIMESVKKVTDIVGDITVASHEQAQGIEQVNKAIIDMDTTTQQNAALVEEAAAAAESMSEQSNELTHLIGFFSNSGDNQHDSRKIDHSSSQQSAMERRTSERPWSNESTHSKKSTPIQTPVKKAVGEDFVDDDWEEF